MATIEGICNQALDVIGFKRHIGNLQEGSTVSRIALDAWSQTRNSLLSKMNPDWARRDMQLTLLKSAPAGGYGSTVWSGIYPELPWQFEYQYPADCISPLQIKVTPAFIPIYRPRTIPFRLNFDQNSNMRTILCNAPNAILVYIAEVFDPNNWHEEFIDIMIAILAKKFEQELADHPMMAQREEKQDANPSG